MYTLQHPVKFCNNNAVYGIVEGQQKINEKLTNDKDQAKKECSRLSRKVSCLQEEVRNKEKIINDFQYLLVRPWYTH